MITHPICTHRDHALLACIVGEANARIQEDGRGNVTRRALMTAFCYCKLAGVPTTRRFAIHPSGPASEELLLDIEGLESDEAVKNVSMEPDHHADYISGVGALALCAEHRAWVETQRATVVQVIAMLSPLTPGHLAQVACLHFLFLYLRRELAGSELREAVIAQFLVAAPDEGWTVSKDDANALYQAMETVGLIH